jgi:hypothetical protein
VWPCRSSKAIAVRDLAVATGQTEESLLEWVDAVQGEVVGRLTEVLDTQEWRGEQLLADAWAADPAGFERAALASLQSGTLAPLLGRVASFIDRDVQGVVAKYGK